jgi:Zn-dependent protease with chaperone function
LRDGNRAAFSAAMLAGFWLIAWLQVAVVLVVVLVVLSLLPGGLALRAAAPLCVATAGLLGYATVRALRLRRATPAGVPVTRTDAPALWSMIDAAAAAGGVAPPDGVTVIAEAAASLTERARLAGLLGGRRELYLGLPLLQAWDAARLRAAVAHELAHDSPRLGRFAPLAYRGRVAVGRIVPRIPARNPAGPLLRAYARWYHRRDAPFSRAQELAADQIAAAFAGPRAAVAVLRDGPALDGLQRLFHAEYLSPGWQAGYVPDDVFGGFLRVLAARADEVALLRAQHPEPPPPRDTHPPVAERLAALTALLKPPTPADSPATDTARPDTAGPHPEAEGGTGPGVPGSDVPGSDVPGSGVPGSDLPGSGGRGLGDGGPAGADVGLGVTGPGVGEGEPGGEFVAAGDMVPDLPGLGRALQAVAYPVAGRTVTGWDEFFGVARKAEMEREADAALRAISRAAGTPVAGAGAVFDLAADGRLAEVAKTVFGELPAEETAEHIAGLITLLLALAALNSGVARWRHSWSGTAELVAMDGSHLDLGGPAALAGDPATVGAARERLAALGIDLAATAAAGGAHPAARVPVLGGVVNVLVDGARTDLLVVETGLFLVPGLPRSRNGDAKRRLARLAAGGVRVDGSAAGAPVPAVDGAASSRFVPFADVAAAVAVPSRRRNWEVSLQDGGTLTIRTALDSDELPGGWTALDDAVAFLSRTR